MDFPKFINDNIQLIISNPVPFITLSFFVFSATWYFVAALYKERIETLKERISSKDDQLKYLQKLTDEKQSTIIPAKDNISTHQPVANLSEDILREIKFLKQHAGKAISMQFFERLQPKYDFTVILSEIISMYNNNEIAWNEAPDPPSALSEIKLQKHGAT